MKIVKLLLPTLIPLLTQPVFADPAPALPAYGADNKQVSVSGLSSGGFMTAQIHVTYSERFIGAGVLAAGPYYCAGSYESNDYLTNATTTCMQPITASLGPKGAKLYEKAKEFAEQGLIDDVEHLKGDKAYIFTGSADSVVHSPVVKQVYEFYKAAGIPEENLYFNDQIKAGHAILTDNAYDHECSVNEAPYINDCDFFQSHELLKTIYGELNPPATQRSGKIIEFDQTEFIDSDISSMSPIGFAYIPENCETKSCPLHVVFHGCEQGYTVIGSDYYRTTGYNEMGASNDIIMLYPQAHKSETAPYNPKGCWDFWGYSSPDPNKPNFYTKEAPQMKAVIKMIDRLTSPRAE